ncbi:DUF3047 domain-containing protein [bacterium]|nr:DUF3047 domain-containing protein [bacterium]
MKIKSRSWAGRFIINPALIVLVSGLLQASIAFGEETVFIGQFSKSDLKDWEIKEFKDKNTYSIVSVEGKTVLKTESNGTASAFYKTVEIDLKRTPYLNWSWKVENIFPDLDEQTKDGDDFPARVYVVVSSGFAFWKTKAINYVWSSNNPVGDYWPNPFTNNVIMVPLQSGVDKINTWTKEKRNVREDLIEFLGIEALTLDGVAVMTDTDNSNGKAVAYYGDVYFTSE